MIDVSFSILDNTRSYTMIWQLTTVLCLVVCVLGDGHAISEQKVVRHDKEHHGDLSHKGSNEPEHHEDYADAYPSYEFSYKVEDPHTHDMKGQQESRHGDDVKGEYWLIEPDGRKRIVKYEADKHHGFNAHVEYSAPHHHETKKHEEPAPVVDHHHEEEARMDLPRRIPLEQHYQENYHHPRFHRGYRQ